MSLYKNLKGAIDSKLRSDLTDSAGVLALTTPFSTYAHTKVTQDISGNSTTSEIDLNSAASSKYWGRGFDWSCVSTGYQRIVGGVKTFYYIFGVLISRKHVLILRHATTGYLPVPANTDYIFFRTKNNANTVGGTYKVAVDSVVADVSAGSGDYYIIELAEEVSENTTVVNFFSNAESDSFFNLTTSYPCFSFSPVRNGNPQSYIHQVEFDFTGNFYLTPHAEYGRYPAQFVSGMSGGPVIAFLYDFNNGRFIPFLIGLNLYTGQGRGFYLSSEARKTELNGHLSGSGYSLSVITAKSLAFTDLRADYSIDFGYNYDRTSVLQDGESSFDTFAFTPSYGAEITFKHNLDASFLGNYNLSSLKNAVDDITIKISLPFTNIKKSEAQNITKFLDSKKGSIRFQLVLPSRFGYQKMAVFCEDYSVAKEYFDSVDLKVELTCDSYSSSLDWRKNSDQVVNIASWTYGASYSKGDVVYYSDVAGNYYKSKRDLFFVCKSPITNSNHLTSPENNDIWSRKFIWVPSYPLQINNKYKTATFTDEGYSKRFHPETNYSNLSDMSFNFENLPHRQALNIVKFLLARNMERYKMEIPDPFVQKKVFVPLQVTHKINSAGTSSISISATEDSLGVTALGKYEDSLPNVRLEGLSNPQVYSMGRSFSTPNLPYAEIDVFYRAYSYDYSVTPVSGNNPYSEIDVSSQIPSIDLTVPPLPPINFA